MSTTPALSLASRTPEAFTAPGWDTPRELRHEDVVDTGSGTGHRLEGIDNHLAALREWAAELPDVHGTPTPGCPSLPRSGSPHATGGPAT